MTKLTDEELSRVLGEHDAGQLMPEHYRVAFTHAFYWNESWPNKEEWKPCGCIEQTAKNDPGAWQGDVVVNPYYAGQTENSAWFETKSKFALCWTPDRLLHELEKAGIA